MMIERMTQTAQELIDRVAINILELRVAEQSGNDGLNEVSERKRTLQYLMNEAKEYNLSRELITQQVFEELNRLRDVHNDYSGHEQRKTALDYTRRHVNEYVPAAA